LSASISRENIFALEQTIADFLDYLLVRSSDPDLSYGNMLVLRTLCVLTWREAFTQSAAQILADVIARLLVEKLRGRTLRNLLIYLAASSTDVALILATVLRLTTHALRQLAPQLWESVARDQVRFSIDASAFEFTGQTDNVRARLAIAYDLYVTEACLWLTKFSQLRQSGGFPRASVNLSDADMHSLARLLIPRHLEAELLRGKDRASVDLSENKTLDMGNGHVSLIAWAVDKGYDVREYALAFLALDDLDDVAFSAKLLPHFLPRVHQLAVDGAVSVALIGRLSALRQKQLPFNHHLSLLKGILPLLTPTVKADLLGTLHSKPNSVKTPLPSSNSQFANQMRNFLNHLVAIDDVGQEAGVDRLRPWVSLSARSSDRLPCLSKESLIECELLLLTRPFGFLLEIIRLPADRRCAALLPTVHQIIEAVSYCFGVRIATTEQPGGAPLLNHFFLPHTQLLPYLSATVNSKISDLQAGAEVLQHYLPTKNLDSLQVSIAAQTLSFLKTSVPVSPEKLLAVTPKSEVVRDAPTSAAISQASEELGISCLSSLLDIPSTWALLPSLLKSLPPISELPGSPTLEQLYLMLTHAIRPLATSDSPLFVQAPEPALQLCEHLLNWIDGSLTLAVSASANTRLYLMQACVDVLNQSAHFCAGEDHPERTDLWKSLSRRVAHSLSSDPSLLWGCLDAFLTGNLSTCTLKLLPAGDVEGLLDLSIFTKRLKGNLRIVSSSGFSELSIEAGFLKTDNDSNSANGRGEEGGDRFSQTSTDKPHVTSSPISTSTLLTLLQLASASDSLWLATVESLLAAGRSSTPRRRWNSLSPARLLLSVFTFLHHICADNSCETAMRWGRAIGLIDQLVAARFLRLPYRIRCKFKDQGTSVVPPLIDWSPYVGCLDLFEFSLNLLALASASLPEAHLPSASDTRLLCLVCQTVESLVQRLRTRIVHSITSATNEDDDLSRHNILPQISALISEARSILLSCSQHIDGKSASATDDSALSLLYNATARLTASLELLEGSLSSALAEVNC
uniref:Mediator complex subunit 5 n=1 Tax=Schistocephalus solidus TaxID=70667 RepID=A0A183SVS0_SCHSO